MDEYAGSGWCCVDCLMWLANGEAPADWTAGQVTAWQAEIDRRNDGYNLTLGMMREDHSCLDKRGRTAGDLGGECECEQVSFSWSACDVCGSNLGGQRDAVSWWKIAS